MASLNAFSQEIVGEENIPDIIPPTLETTEALRVLLADNEAAKRAGQAFVDQANSLEPKPPNPPRELHYEGLVNTDPARIITVGHLQDMHRLAVYFQAWLISGEPRYAEHIQEITTAWAATYEPTGNTINENKLRPLFSAYVLMRNSYPPEEREKIDAWLERITELQIQASDSEEHSSGNWQTKRLLLIAILGWALENPETQDYVITKAREFIGKNLEPDGTSFDFHHRDTLTYHMSTLRPLFSVGLLLREPIGDPNLYEWEAENGASLRKSTEFVLPFARGEQTREEWVNSQVPLDKKRAEAGIAKYQPGKKFDPQDAAEFIAAASLYDPELVPLARELHGAPDEPFPNWELLINTATILAMDTGEEELEDEAP